MSEIEKMYKNVGIKSIGFNIYNLEDEYPPFTAEKQLELIKWIIIHSPDTCLEDEIIVCAFEDSLANIINTIWQHLTKEEKQQVKRILK